MMMSFICSCRNKKINALHGWKGPQVHWAQQRAGVRPTDSPHTGQTRARARSSSAALSGWGRAPGRGHGVLRLGHGLMTDFNCRDDVTSAEDSAGRCSEPRASCRVSSGSRSRRAVYQVCVCGGYAGTSKIPLKKLSSVGVKSQKFQVQPELNHLGLTHTLGGHALGAPASSGDQAASLTNTANAGQAAERPKQSARPAYACTSCHSTRRGLGAR
jgi:hypothetical protein